MKNLDSKQQVINILETVIKSDNKKLDALFTKELVESSKMRTSEVKSILGLRTDLNELPIEKLIYLYSAILTVESIKNDIPKIDEFFEDQEIRHAENLRIERIKSQYPIKLKAYKQTNKEDYVVRISAKQLEEWKDNGVIKLDKDMARESNITNYKGQLISSISYNDKRAREIGDKMATNNFYSNGIRLHAINNESLNYEFIQPQKPDEEGEGQLVIKSGDIALIEGNHRINGVEYALLENPDVYLYLTVFFSFGTIKDGQFIIDQEEKREPLKKELVKTYSSASESNIVKDLKSEVSDVYKFCKTIQEVNQGGGFVLEPILIDSIKEYYDDIEDNKPKEVKVRQWLSEFLNELSVIFNKDFKNYLSVKKSKWNVSPYAFAGYIYLSSTLQGKENWEQKLSDILSSIDFSVVNKPWRDSVSKPDKLIVKCFKEAVNNVFG